MCNFFWATVYIYTFDAEMQLELGDSTHFPACFFRGGVILYRLVLRVGSYLYQIWGGNGANVGTLKYYLDLVTLLRFQTIATAIENGDQISHFLTPLKVGEKCLKIHSLIIGAPMHVFDF